MKNAKSMVAGLMMVLSVMCSFSAMADEGRRKVSRTFDLEKFEAIEVNVPCDIEYISSGTPALRMLANSDAVIDAVQVEVIDGVLIIKWEQPIRRFGSLKLYVESRYLNSLKVNGAGDFEALKCVSSNDEFKLQINGSGDVDIHSLSAKNLYIKINGASDTEIAGLRCDLIDLQINGAGDCDLEGKTDVLNVKINGAGDVDVSDLQVGQMNTAIRGAGNIERH